MSKTGSASRGGSLVWLQGLACGGMAALAPSVAVLLVVLLAPGLVALMLDREPGRPLGRTILLCGAAACVAPVGQLWNNGQTVEASFAILGDMVNLAAAWSAAAAGWLLAELLPVAVRAVLEAVSLTRSAQLRAARQRLIEEWGPGSTPGQ